MSLTPPLNLTLLVVSLHLLARPSPRTLPVSRTCAKRSLAMRRARVGGRRTLSSSSWPRCCRCRGPSPASWTRPRSSGSPSATCTCALSPARETRPGAPWWRETATAAKVRSGDALVFIVMMMSLCPFSPMLHLFSQIDAIDWSLKN